MAVIRTRDGHLIVVGGTLWHPDGRGVRHRVTVLAVDVIDGTRVVSGSDHRRRVCAYRPRDLYSTPAP